MWALTGVAEAELRAVAGALGGAAVAAAGQSGQISGSGNGMTSPAWLGRPWSRRSGTAWGSAGGERGRAAAAPAPGTARNPVRRVLVVRAGFRRAGLDHSRVRRHARHRPRPVHRHLRTTPLGPLLANGWSHAHGGKSLNLVPCRWPLTSDRVPSS